MRRRLALAAPVAVLMLGAALAACGQADSAEAADRDAGGASSAAGLVDLDNLAVLHPTVWLCRPGMVDNPCESDLDASVEPAHGEPTVERFQPREDPPVDCFYVYPTTSTGAEANAPLRADEAPLRTVRAQAGRFSAQCRVFAPVYRQYTADALLSSGAPLGQAIQTAYADVRSAWHDYLVNDNRGRPFVLIGHDQGAGHLVRLIREEIDEQPALRDRLVSAILVGANVEVPAGQDVGGDFQNVPACRRHDQIGCVVAYSAYLSTPPANAAFGRIGGNALRFGRELSSGRTVLCTNPAALGGGPADLSPYFPTAALGGDFLYGYDPASLVARDTPFVSYPGLLRAECRSADGASWLQVDTRSQPGDSRQLPQLTGPPSWGLHTLDVNLALGDLVTLVGRQSSAYLTGTYTKVRVNAGAAAAGGSAAGGD